MQLTKENNYVYMLVGLLSILLLAPALDLLGQAVSEIITHGSLMIALVISVWSLMGSKKWFKAGIALTITVVILTGLSIAFKSAVLFSLTLLTILFFLAISIAIVFSSVFMTKHVNVNKIIGAVCIYLMIGIIWAIFYYYLTLLQPDSFKGLQSELLQGKFTELVYYSFVTLTTLGFGDITPLVPMARTLTYIEAITGQIYLTVLVAALVGMHISYRPNEEPD